MNIENSAPDLAVFRALRDRYLRDFHQGATQLCSRIEADMGKGVRLSATSLAQEAQRILEHVQKIRYTQGFFKRNSMCDAETEISGRYIQIEKNFQNQIVERLADIALPEDPYLHRPKTFLERLRDRLEQLVPGEVSEEAERSEMGIGRISDVSPELQHDLERIIEELATLLDRLEKMPVSPQ